MRPRTEPRDRVQTQVRLPRDLYEALRDAAQERELSTNYLITQAIKDFLPRLMSPSEWKLTK